jgi:hypothetical protein
VNNPAFDGTSGSGFTQSETSTTVIPQGGGQPSIVLVSFNSSAAFNNDGSSFSSYAISTDGGLTFTDKGTILPIGQNNDLGDPVFTRDEVTGNVYYAALADNGFSLSNIQVYTSTNNGQSFNAPVDGTPGTSFSQDKEWIRVDNFPGTGQGNLYLVNRDFDVGNGIIFYKSTDHGQTFGPTNGVLIASGAGGNVQGPNVAVGPDHSVYVAYYDDVTGPAQQLRIRRSTDFGATFSKSVKITDLVTTGQPNGNLGLGFRTSPFPQMVVNPVNGDVYIAYADLSASGDADVFFTMSTDQGATWSAPQRVNDDTTTTAQWQASLAVSPDGQHVFMGWYDRRLDPNDQMIDTFGEVAQVNTGTHAVTFKPNFRITNASFPAVFGTDGDVNGVYMGDYDESAADSNFFYYSWGDNRLPSAPDVRLARIPIAGPAGPTVTLTAPSGTISTQPNAVTIDFNQAMDETSFNLNDVLSFTGPLAPPYDNLKNYISKFQWLDNKTLEIDFATQVTKGDYTMVLGPNIKSTQGVQLDENLNGTPGETPADDVTINFTYDPGIPGYIKKPTALILNTPYTVNEGGTLTLKGSGSDSIDPPNALIYQWDLNGNGVFGESSTPFGNETLQNPVFNATGLDGPGTYQVQLRVTDQGGLTSDPVSTTITIVNVPPTVSISGKSSAGEGSTLTYKAMATDPSIADTKAGFTYVWSVKKNGVTFNNFAGQGTTQIQLTDPDAPATPDQFQISVAVTDKDGGTGKASTTTTVNNVAPTAKFSNNGPKQQGTNVTFQFTNQSDPSVQDTAAGFRYSYDFNNNGSFTDPGDILNSPSPTATKLFPNFGTFTVHGRITDKDGGSTDYFTTVTVTRLGNGGIVTTHYFAAGADAGGGPEVKLFNNDGSVKYDFFAYDPSFAGGVRVATGDVNGDQTEDLITAPGPGGGSDIKVFDGSTGALIHEFFAFDPSFTGGVWIASADVNNDHTDDIIVGAGPGGGPEVKVIDGTKLGQVQPNGEIAPTALLGDFFAFAPSFAGGVSVAAADVNNDHFNDIIVGAGAGGGPEVKVIGGTKLGQLQANGQIAPTALLGDFFAFDAGFSGGVTVAGGDVNGDGLADIYVGSGAGSSFDSKVRVFSGADFSIIWDYVVVTLYKGGVRVGSEDLNGDGKADIVISTGSGFHPRVLGLDGTNLHQILNFDAFDPGFMGGVFVG